VKEKESTMTMSQQQETTKAKRVRPTWDDYFMTIARAASARSTCDRKSVGCVAVLDRRILSTGYNGAPRGLPHCDDVGHDLVNDSCARVVHAEANAVYAAARTGISLAGATFYVTCSPCWACFRAIAQVGGKRVVFGERFYRDVERISAVASALGIDLVDLSAGAVAP
jgi:dCMP deaminase